MHGPTLQLQSNIGQDEIGLATTPAIRSYAVNPKSYTFRWPTALLSLLTCVLACSFRTTPGQLRTTHVHNTAQPEIQMALDSDGHALRITIRNNGSSSLRCVDPFADNTGIPYSVPMSLAVKVQDTQGRILSESSLSPNGYWSPALLASQTLELPAKLVVLDPGEEIAQTIRLRHLLAGSEQYFSLIQDAGTSYMMRFSLVLYLDAALKETMRTETEWLVVRDVF